MQVTIGVWSPTVLGVKLHTVPGSLLVRIDTVVMLDKVSLLGAVSVPSARGT